MRHLAVVTLVMLTIAGCSDEFDPSVSGPRPYVVFAVLNPAVDTQYVRVHATSEPTDPHPPVVGIPGTSVSIIGPTGTINFQPVDLRGTPGTADSVIPAFMAPGFRPTRGAAYTLVVTTPVGNATGSLEVPSYSSGAMNVRDFLLIQNPHSYPLSATIVTTAVLARQTLGFTMRFEIEYDVLKNGVWVVETWEVPLAYREMNGPTDYSAEYPIMRRRNGSASVGAGPQTSEVTIYTNNSYEATISLIHAKYGSQNILMKRAIILLQQADRHFFTYYSYANSFQDRLTIRVDQPDYSNMEGSLGFFGSMTIDSLTYPLSSNLAPR